MKNAVFWDVALCKSCVNRHFGGTGVPTRSTQRHIPEDGILQDKTYSLLDIFTVALLLACYCFDKKVCFM
jgi:hypothetical protein